MLEEFKDRLANRLNNKVSTMAVTANPETVMAANKDPKFMKLIKEGAGLVTTDGIGTVLGGRMLKIPIKECVTGCDLFIWLSHTGNLRKLRVCLIGTAPIVMEITKAKIARDYPGTELIRTRNGYFEDGLKTVTKRIRNTEPNLVSAAIGLPRQEELISSLRQAGVPAVMIGVGGNFDVFSGMAGRAPEVFQETHFKWFYRLITNPTRLKRTLVLLEPVVGVRGFKKRK